MKYITFKSTKIAINNLNYVWTIEKSSSIRNIMMPVSELKAYHRFIFSFF